MTPDLQLSSIDEIWADRQHFLQDVIAIFFQCNSPGKCKSLPIYSLIYKERYDQEWSIYFVDNWSFWPVESVQDSGQFCNMNHDHHDQHACTPDCLPCPGIDPDWLGLVQSTGLLVLTKCSSNFVSVSKPLHHSSIDFFVSTNETSPNHYIMCWMHV